jgi:hypothetical protein
MIYRLATKAFVPHSNQRDFLLPYQFGVGSRDGVERVVRAVESALEGTLDRPYTHLTSLDFSNAFNTVDRRDIAEGHRQYAPVSTRPRDGHMAALPNPPGQHPTYDPAPSLPGDLCEEQGGATWLTDP